MPTAASSSLPSPIGQSSSAQPPRPPSRLLGPALLALGLVAASLALGLFVRGPEAILIALNSPSPPTPLDPPVPSAPHQPACPADPYALPGLLSLTDYRPASTRWVPFSAVRPPAGQDLALTLADVRDRDAAAVDGLEVEEQDERLFVALAEGRLGGLEWARGRTIALIGSSHDRNNFQQVAAILDLEYANWGNHRGGAVVVPALNLTLVHYFLYGMVDDEDAGWFAPDEQRPITFERRLALLEARRREEGLAPPDLAIAASLFWDEKLFGAEDDGFPRAHPLRVGLTVPEAAWHSQRVASLLAHLAALWPDARLMLRTRHHRAGGRAGGRLRLAQLDASERAAAAAVTESGTGAGVVGLFRWGDLLEGWEDYYDHDMHFQPGPSTFLFANMALAYLRLAVLPHCWPPPASSSSSSSAAAPMPAGPAQPL